MKKFKKLASIFLIFAMVTALYGCGSKKPTDVVSDYFKGLQKGDTNVEELLSKVSGDSDKEVNDDTFSDETNEKILDSVKKITFKVNSENIDGETATVNVTVNSMDMGPVLGNVMKDIFSYAFEQAFSGVETSEEDDDKYMDSLFNKYMDEVTFSDKTEDVTLIKEDGEWKIQTDDKLEKLVIGLDSSSLKSLEGK